MRSRVALGHTGRPLALPRGMGIAYAALLLAGAARVGIPLLVPTAMALAWDIAGALWCVAFGLFAVVYARILTSPRPDGRPG
ncbi:MAG TPA: NnrS family protein, partial [Myxococcota bacterium]|nr:NnrS family protein [Myxococcota bacterium]